MSSEAVTNIRGYLVSSSNVTSIVPAKDITIGWRKNIDNFPCIIIKQVAGLDKGYLGYVSDGSSRTRQEDCIISVDIYSRTSGKQTYTIADAIVPLMIASGGCKKLNDIDNYDDDISVYKKTQVYQYTLIHLDD